MILERKDVSRIPCQPPAPERLGDGFFIDD